MLKVKSQVLLLALFVPAMLLGQAGKLGPVPQDPGLYYWNSNSLQPVEGQAASVARSGNPFGSAATFGIKRMKLFQQIPGEHSSHVTDTQPTFFYRAPSGAEAAGAAAGDLVLTRLTAKRDRREIEVGNAGLTGATMGIPISSQIPVARERLGSDLYQLKPAQPLKPGEYAFYLFRGYDLPGYIYDFSVKYH